MLFGMLGILNAFLTRYFQVNLSLLGYSHILSQRRSVFVCFFGFSFLFFPTFLCDCYSFMCFFSFFYCCKLYSDTLDRMPCPVLKHMKTMGEKKKNSTAIDDLKNNLI